MSDPNIYEMGEKIAQMVRTQFKGTEVFVVLTAMRLATIHLEIQSEAIRQAEFLTALDGLPAPFRDKTSTEANFSCEAGG